MNCIYKIRKSKKGIIVPALAVLMIFFVAYSLIAFNYLGEKPVTKTIGESQVEIIRAFNEGRIFLVYVDQSARLAGYKAVNKLAENGGLVESECGEIREYTLWLKKGKECYPDNFEESFLHYFEEIFKELLLKHELVKEEISYDYKISEGSLIVSGVTSEGVFIRDELRVVLGEEIKEGVSVKEEVVEDKTVNELVKRYSSRYNLDENLIKGVIRQESNFNSEAVSSAGAKGLMQLTDDVVSDLSNEETELGRFCMVEIDNVFDAEQNINGGSCYLKFLINKYNGDVELALAGYNWGPGNVDKNCGKSFLECSNLPQETEEYVPKVLAFKEDYESGIIEVTSAAAVNVKEKEENIKISYKVNPSFRQKIDYELDDYEKIIKVVRDSLDCLRLGSSLEVQDCIKDEEFEWVVIKEEGVVFVDVSTMYKLFGDKINVKFALEFNNL